MNEQDKAEIRLEDAVGNLFGALYNTGKVFGSKRMFDDMGVIMDMISEARMDLIKSGKIKI